MLDKSLTDVVRDIVGSVAGKIGIDLSADVTKSVSSEKILETAQRWARTMADTNTVEAPGATPAVKPVEVAAKKPTNGPTLT
jgi:hypothetical protein